RTILKNEACRKVEYPLDAVCDTNQAFRLCYIALPDRHSLACELLYCVLIGIAHQPAYIMALCEEKFRQTRTDITGRTCNQIAPHNPPLLLCERERPATPPTASRYAQNRRPAVQRISSR